MPLAAKQRSESLATSERRSFMDNWVAWIIPLIALVLWIVANLFRVPQEQPPPAQRPRPRPEPRGDVPRRADAPPVAEEQQPIRDLDKFLQEVKRRRDEAERQPPRPAPPPTRPTHAERKPSPAPPPLPKRPAPPPVPRSLPPQPSAPVVLETIPEVLPSARPVAAHPGRREPELAARLSAVEESKRARDAAEIGTRAEQPGFREGARAAQLIERPESAVAVQVRQLISDADTLRAAFVLREILDRPVSQRPPRRV
jgi:hypothetical protein